MPAPQSDISSLEKMFSLSIKASTETTKDPAAAASDALLSPKKKLGLHYPSLPVKICEGTNPHSAFTHFFETSTSHPPFVVGYPTFLTTSPRSFERYVADLQRLLDLAGGGWEVSSSHPEGVGEGGGSPVACVVVNERVTATPTNAE